MRVMRTDETEGFQIDLLIDRKDGAVNLCEIKFQSGPFVINKEYYQRLIEKRQRFITYTGTPKTVLLTLLTNHGVADNSYSREIIDSVVQLEDLF